MAIIKKEVFVLVIKEKEVSCGIYKIGQKPLIISYQEQTFSEDVFLEGYIFNLPLFVDFIQHFLQPYKRPIPLIICLDDAQSKEGFYAKQKKVDHAITEKTAMKEQTLQLPVCCSAAQYTYQREIAYPLLFQYTLLFGLLNCTIISVISPLISLIYFNHQYGGTKHQLANDNHQTIRVLLEKRCFSLLRDTLPKTDSHKQEILLSLYSATAAYAGARKL